MIKNINLFELLTIPLVNKITIENYLQLNDLLISTIIYCRLLLHINLDKKLICLLNNHKFIIISYSKNKNIQLKNYIYYFLKKIKLAFLYKKKNNNILIEYFVNNISKKKINYLLSLENKFEKNPILDIVSFYKNIIFKKYFFLNNNKFIYKTNINYNKVIIYFWQKYILNFDIFIKNIILNIWHNVYYFKKSIRKVLKNNNNNNKFDKKLNYYNIIKINKDNINFINYIKKKITLISLDELKKKFLKSNINKRIYNKRNLERWYNKLLIWSNNNTINYLFPSCIKYFSQKFINSKSNINIPKYSIFKFIDILLKKNFYIKDILINRCLKLIKSKIKKLFLLKYYKINFYNKKSKKINNVNKLIKKINIKYPLIIINNFNIKLFNFFNIIFSFKNSNIIILNNNKININIKNKYKILYKYKNINIINLQIYNLFSKNFNIFKYNNKILFNNKYNIPNININILLQGLIYLFYNPTNNNISINEYINQISIICALKIKELIYKKYKFYDFKYKKFIDIKYKHITIFVKNNNEAKLIQKRLNILNIPSLYLSKKYNIFYTIEAKELYNILLSIIYPNNNFYIQLLISNVKLIFKKYNKLYEQLLIYNKIWYKLGIINVINYFLEENNPFILSLSKNIELLNNLNYLIRILYQQEIIINNKIQLLIWFKNQFNNINNINNINKPLNKIFSNIINIINIDNLLPNKNYYIGFLPFSCTIENNKSNIKLIYILLNKIIKTIFLGISPISFNINNINRYESNLNNTLIGYLLQNKKKIDIIQLIILLKKQYKKKISIYINYGKKIINKKIYKNYKIKIKKTLISYNKNKYFKYNTNKFHKNIINYSKLKTFFYNFQKKKSLFLYPLNYIKKKKKKFNNLNQFPRGITSGLFFHSIFNKINNGYILTNNYLMNKLSIYNINVNWTNYLLNWFNMFYITPIKILNKKIILNEIETNNKLSEVKFSLYIKNILLKYLINKFFVKNININIYNYILNKIELNIKSNILNGSIDLLIFYNKKYYLIDYKSNWLGNSIFYYNNNNLLLTINKYYYNLQYIIYILAINKFLKLTLYNYNYEQHFGGVIYLFIRGLNYNKRYIKKYGIYYIKPNLHLINKLTNLNI